MADTPLAPPLVRIHSQAQAALVLAEAAAHGRRVRLISSRGAPGVLGRAWFRRVTEEAARTHPGTLAQAATDCGDAPGHALACLEDGAKAIAVCGLAPGVLERLRSLASAQGAELWIDPQPDLDLLGLPDPAAACRTLFAD